MTAAALLDLREIDDHACNGRFQLVSDGDRFSVARWNGDAFVYSSGAAVEFTPTQFHAETHGG